MPNHNDTKNTAVDSKTTTQISFLSVVLYLSEALFVIRGFLLAKILGPVYFGIWSQMRLTFMFLQYARLGTNEAMLREYPYASGKGDLAQAEKIKRTVTAFNIGFAACIAAVIFLILVAGELAGNEYDTFWFLYIGVFFVRQIYWYVHLILEAQRRFFLKGKLVAGFAFLSTGGGLFLAYYYNLNGFLWALALAHVCMIVFAMLHKTSIFELGWSSRLAVRLIKTGFPIMASSALFILLLNVDKLVIWALLLTEDLGIYAVQSYIINAIMVAPGAITMVLFPTMMENLGRTDSISKIEKLLNSSSLILAYLACPILGVLYLFLPLPIEWLLPKYAPAIVPGQILILSSFFIIISRIPATILVSMNKQNSLFFISIFSVLSAVALDSFFIYTDLGLVGVAVGTACSFFIYAVSTIIFSMWTLRIYLKRMIVFLFNLAVPYLCTIVSIFMASSLIIDKSDGWISALIQTTIQCLVFLLPVCTVLFIASKKMKIFNLRAFEINGP